MFHNNGSTNFALCNELAFQPRSANGRFRRKAVVSKANRKQLRWTVHSDLNRLPTAGRLWCAYVALRVFVDCYRPIAAALIEQAGSSALYMTGAATGAR